MRRPVTPSRVPRSAHGLVPKVLRYTGGSVVATVCSEVAFALLYGPLDLSPGWASVGGWLAGALPNYWLNRRWTWRRTDRPHVVREILPYVGIVAVTLVVATLATRAVDGALGGSDLSGTARTALVAGAFLGVYVVMFALRFVLLDRLFSRLATLDHRRRQDGDPTPTAERMALTDD